MNILALDVATTTGYATSSKYGNWTLKKRDDSAGMKLIRFKQELIKIIKEEKIELIVFERSSGMHKSSIITQSELHGVLKLLAEELGINYLSYSAKEIKSHATGNGNASKNLMIEKAKEKLNYKGNSSDEADALWIYDLANSKFNI